MQDFKKLRVWQRSHDLVLAIYRSTNSFPESERFGIIQQLRKAVFSITANLAEGSSRRGDVEFRRFLFMSMGSASEVENALLISRDLGYMEKRSYEQLRTLVEEVRRMLCRLADRLTSTSKKEPGFEPGA